MMRKAYMKYVSHINNIETGKQVAAGTLTPLMLDTHPSGLPWVPVFDPQKHKENLRILQNLLRKYWAQHYGMWYNCIALAGY